mmetsp:Transcript_49394/g.87013  ORF Transcript_49394/g.87013 Transcript_49394/m.87013 type:complete len:157 (-) Transcript_49394:68-538(-)
MTMALQGTHPKYFPGKFGHPSFGYNDDLVDMCETEPLKTLVMRSCHIRYPEMVKLCNKEYRKANNYSVYLIPLVSGSPFSGRGTEKGYVANVYFDPLLEKYALRALRTVGVDMSEYEQTLVDPNSQEVHEVQFLNSEESGFLVISEEERVMMLPEK